MIRKSACSLLAILGWLGSMLHGEETNGVGSPFAYTPIHERLSTIEYLSRRADVAGVGLFLDCPTPSNPTVGVHVQDFWAGNSGTNVLRISINEYKEFTDWIHPTNAPVVFFAFRPATYMTNAWSDVANAAELYPGRLTDMSLSFPFADRAWFRTTRDNGLLYAFATNLWDSVRANPNPTNFYKVLRDADSPAYTNSSRVVMETSHGLFSFFRTCTDTDLLEKFQDPLLNAYGKNVLENELLNRGWTYTNGSWALPQ